MRTRLPLMVVAGVSTMLLAACYESPGVTFHEPGEYKGEQDPLLSKLDGDSELGEKLDKRFDGQRDR